MTLYKKHFEEHPIYGVLLAYCQVGVGIYDEVTSIELITDESPDGKSDNKKFSIRYRYVNVRDDSSYQNWDYQNWAVITPESHGLYNYIRKEVKSILRDIKLTKMGI